MPSPSKQDPFSHDFWKTEPAPKRTASLQRDSFNAHTYLFPIDEVEEFYDPFSDLSLFLAKRIKKELLNTPNPKKWSRTLQTLLLKEILPEFSKKFPGYRLGLAALRKTWDKVLYYLQMIQQQKQALKANGKLNIDFMIRENLKEFLLHAPVSTLHPYNAAHRLAVKISECIATIDGERPELDLLTKMIWSVQKQLIPKEELSEKPPFENYDMLDKLIIRFQLETTTHQNDLSREELQKVVIQKIKNVHQLERIRNVDDLAPALSALLAEKFYPTLSLHNLPSEKLILLSSFIKKAIADFSSKHPDMAERERLQLVKRILFLYKLKMRTPKQAAFKSPESALESAIHYVHSLSREDFEPSSPVLNQESYNFIQSELLFLKNKSVEDPRAYLLSTLMDLFNQIQKLPCLENLEEEEIEIFIWKVMNEEYDLLTKIPLYLREVIYEQLASVHIDHAKESFHTIVSTTLHYFKKIRTLNIELLEEKAALWSLQNDLLCYWLHFEEEGFIMRAIKEVYSREEVQITDSSFAEAVLEQISASHPHLKGWRSALGRRIQIMIKYYWYNDLRKPTETAQERFLKWHLDILQNAEEVEFPEVLLTELEELSLRLLPLTPFVRSHARSLLY